MSAALPFDPTCPWKVSCNSRRITTCNGLLRHLQRFHNLTFSGRDEWLSRLRNAPDYCALAAALRASGNWLCTTCFKTHALGVHSRSTHPDTCQRLWNLENGLLPPDVNVLPGLPRPVELSPQQEASRRTRLRSPGSSAPPRALHRDSTGPAPPGSHQLPSSPPVPPPPGPSGQDGIAAVPDPARIRGRRHALTPELIHRLFTLGHHSYRRVPRSAWVLWAAAFRAALHAVAATGSEAAWVELFILPLCVLSSRRRPRGEGVAQHIRRRARCWSDGNVDDLIDELLETAPPPHTQPRHSDEAALAARVLRKVAEGHLSAAVRMLEPSTIAPATPATCAILEQLHPVRPLPPAVPMPHAPHQARAEDVIAALKTFPPGTAGGRDGLTALHIRHALSVGGSDVLIEDLLGVVNRALAGDLPPALRPFWARAPITPLLKPNGGIRPIAVGLTLRRLVSKVAVAAVLPAVSEYLEPHQVGVGVRGGAEGLVHAFNRLVAEQQHSPDLVVVSLDFQNAFNTVDRNRMLEEVIRHRPSISHYVEMSYGCAARQYVGPHVVESTTGVQQGDPLSPLLFALTVHPLVHGIHQECPDLHQGWFLDDGTFVGTVELAQRAVQLVIDRAPAFGLSLNPQKCRVWSPIHDPLHLHGFPMGFVHEQRPGLTVLGAAITLSVEYAASITQALVDAVAVSLERLALLRHPQVELLLLRSCLGACKVVYTARCTPPTAAAPAFAAFDVLQSRVLQNIVTAGGSGFGPVQQSLGALPIANGGLGITTATSLLPCAYLASVTQTASLQRSILGPSTAPPIPAALAARAEYCALVPEFDEALFQDPDFVRGKVQAQLSKPLCQRAYRELIDDPARSDRDRAVLHSLAQPGASDWLLALPVPHLQQTMAPEQFRCRLQYQLLIPMFLEGSQCPYCLRELDVWGDHAVHCTSGGDVAIVGRHYSVRNGLDAVLTSARQRVTREPTFPTPVPGQERRRADLRLHAWEDGRDLYIDIVGSSPLTVANLQHFVPGGAAMRASQDKQTRYAILLSRQQPPVAFQAFSFETFGGLHSDALALLKRLQGLLNQAIIAHEDVEGYFVLRRVSFIIAAAVGRQLAARRT
jgi:hypothetical protein